MHMLSAINKQQHEGSMVCNIVEALLFKARKGCKVKCELKVIQIYNMDTQKSDQRDKCQCERGLRSDLSGTPWPALFNSYYYQLYLFIWVLPYILL